MTTPYPKLWPASLRGAILQTLSLAHWTITHSRSWCADSPITKVRLASKLERAEADIACLREELRIKDIRLAAIPPHKRPRHFPSERMAILELRTMRGWSLAQTARTFHVDADTITAWMNSVHDPTSTLVQLPPVNKLPDHVAYTVQRLKALIPALGRKRIAQSLTRAGLHLSASSVGRFLKQAPRLGPPLPDTPHPSQQPERTITARYPNHVWHTDLTVVPTAAGRWTAWSPFSLPQTWPFCWHVAAILDHFSRKVVGVAVFTHEPSALQIARFLTRTIHRHGRPRHLITDKGSQFTSCRFADTCEAHGIKRRVGAVGRYGSIAIIERFWRSLKSEGTRRMLVPFSLIGMRRELRCYVDWYNCHRPHQGLGGQVPQEVFAASRHVQRSTAPPATPPTLHITYLRGRKHLPIVSLREAA